MSQAAKSAHLNTLEFLGTFGLVYFAAAVVCLNQLTTPENNNPGLAAMTAQQPGLLGIALVYGVFYAVLLALTFPRAGGGLNPAITLTLWVFNRMETRKAMGLIVAQMVGGFLAGLCIRLTFDQLVLQNARMGTPHLNPLAYPQLARLTLFTGTCLELVLTFFLVLAIFSLPRDGPWAGGAVLLAGSLVLFPLTGAAANPARWFGPCCWEAFSLATVSGRGAWVDTVVYVAGPILGSLLAGLVSFKFSRSHM